MVTDPRVQVHPRVRRTHRGCLRRNLLMLSVVLVNILDVRVRGDVHESDSDRSVWLVEGSRVLVRTA